MLPIIFFVFVNVEWWTPWSFSCAAAESPKITNVVKDDCQIKNTDILVTLFRELGFRKKVLREKEGLFWKQEATRKMFTVMRDVTLAWPVYFNPYQKRKTLLWSDIQPFMSPSENTSLLSTENNAADHDRLHDVYLRFSSTRKNIILAMVSGCIVIHCMLIQSELVWCYMSNVWVDSMIGTFTPSIPQIAKDLNSTGAVVKWSIFQRPF